MGKYPNSELHEKYSDFHWKLNELDPKYKRLYCADIDRQWIEYDFKREAVVAVIDIKKERDLLREELGFSSTEKGIYEWFERRKVCCPICKNSFFLKSADVFIVYISENFQNFISNLLKKNKFIFLIALNYTQTGYYPYESINIF